MDGKVLIAIVFVLTFASIPAIYADGPITTLLSDEKVHLTVLIVVIGIGLKGVIAIMKNGTENFDFRLLGVSLIMGFIASMHVTMVAVEHIPDDVSGTVYLSLIGGQIAAIIGIDSSAKHVGQAIFNKRKKTPVKVNKTGNTTFNIDERGGEKV